MTNPKFRIWDGYKKKLVYPNKKHFFDGNDYMMSMNGILYKRGVESVDEMGGVWWQCGEHQHSNYEKFAGLFTGLLDKNGREIYEGDIVLYINGQSKHEVVSCMGGFRINGLHGKRGILVGAFCETSGKTESLEVLTNIFENPLDKQPSIN